MLNCSDTVRALAFAAILVLGTGLVTNAGPLRVLKSNPRYFTDDSGKAIYLTGSHVWNDFQDWGNSDPPSALNYTEFLNFVQSYNHNFIRGWAWEQAKWVSWSTSVLYISPLPYQRPGPGTALDGKPKFDLDLFNQSYFDRLRARVIEAGKRGIYVGVMLFQGFSIDKHGESGNPWNGHPYNASNNINGTDGDSNDDGVGSEVHTLLIPAVTAIQDRYVKKVIDTLNDLDNIIYEISNEDYGGGTYDSTLWQYHIINLIHNYEARKLKQHPVWMTSQHTVAPNENLLNSPAEAVSLRGSEYMTNLTAASGSKVSILDTDHLWGIGGNRAWVWKSFTRGHNPIFMDPIYGIPLWPRPVDPRNPDYVATRIAMGHTRIYANKMDLNAMTPQNALSATAYCLANPGSEYLVYQPGTGAFTVNLSGATTEFTVEWFNPATGVTTDGGTVAGGGTRIMTPPFSGDAVLYLKKGIRPGKTR